MATLSNSLIPSRILNLNSYFPGQSVLYGNSTNLSFRPIQNWKAKTEISKRQFTVQASFSGNAGGPNSASVFVGGFLLGGMVIGALGCVYAPKISKALEAANENDLMKILPKFIYDDEKVLEKTRKILEEKIAQVNSAIDRVSSELRSDSDPNGAVDASNEIEAAVV